MNADKIRAHGDQKPCPRGLHSDIPIIEGNQTVGLICTICGRRVRENMEQSYLIATERGLMDTASVQSQIKEKLYFAKNADANISFMESSTTRALS
jgi:hypothetical protein